MSKYEGLGNLLVRGGHSEVVLTFAEIERAAGVILPDSARRPQYWENARKPEHIRGANKAAREAGYRSFLIAGADRVRFVRD